MTKPVAVQMRLDEIKDDIAVIADMLDSPNLDLQARTGLALLLDLLRNAKKQIDVNYRKTLHDRNG